MATHGTTCATPHTNIFNMAAIVMDEISSDSGIFCDSKLYHSYFQYNISFIDPPLGGIRQNISCSDDISSGNIITSGNISPNPPRSGYINDNYSPKCKAKNCPIQKRGRGGTLRWGIQWYLT